MLESDSPYLSPSPWKIQQYAALLASLKNMSLSLFNQLTSSNTRALYFIPSVLLQQQPHPQNTAKSILFNQLLNQETVFHSMEQILHFQTSFPEMSHSSYSHSNTMNKSTNVLNQ